MGNKMQALTQEHLYEVENVTKDLNDQHFAEI